MGGQTSTTAKTENPILQTQDNQDNVMRLVSRLESVSTDLFNYLLALLDDESLCKLRTTCK